MTRDSLLDQDWASVVGRLGGAAELEASARATGAFRRPRTVQTAVDLLRLVLAYSLGEHGLRLTAAWASAAGVADLSNVALLYRLRQCGDWLAVLVSKALASAAVSASHGRRVRIVDGTTVLQAGAQASRRNQLWRIHSAFDLPAERFSHFELTDQHGGEVLDRIPVVPGEIRLGDRAYLQVERMAQVIEARADLVVRANCKNARWLDAEGRPLDLTARLCAAAQDGIIDQPIWLGRHTPAAPLRLRLVAVRKSEQARAAARRKARRQARKEGYCLSQAALIAADWVILVTSLPPEHYPAQDVLALYRLRWRIELGFRRLKSIIGLKRPPGADPRSAKPYILAHLLAVLLLEPVLDEFEDSPRSALA